MNSRFMKGLLVVCGTISVGLGVVGIFLPLLPTTVFLLLGAACYARSSERFYLKLINNRWLGTYIRNSRDGRGMTRRHKTVTLVMLWVGIGATAIWSVSALWLRVLLLAVAAGVTIHVAKVPALSDDSVAERA